MTDFRLAARVCAVYLLVGCGWILLSDWFTFVGSDLKTAYWHETIKGLCFVFATAALIFWLIRRDTRLLYESEARFRTLVERAPDAVLVQTKGHIAYVNDALLRLIGASDAHELLGRDVMILIHPVSRDLVRQRIIQVSEQKQPVKSQEETFLRLDGAPVVCDVSAVPIRYDDADGAVVFIRDATDRARAQEQQLCAKELETLRQLAGGLAHEFNNLVQVINGNAELARASLSPGVPEQRYLDHVLFAGRQISEWVGRMMSFSSSRSQSVESLKLNIKDMIEESSEVRPPAVEQVVADVPQESRAEAQDASAPVPALEGKLSKNFSILLAEDDAMVRCLTERFLKKAGYDVLLARDGVEAVAVFEANASRISAIVLDVVMPRMGGFDAYQRISALDKNVPVIFASGFSGYGTPPNLELISGVNFLQKPYDRNDLISAVRRAVETRRAAVFG